MRRMAVLLISIILLASFVGIGLHSISLQKKSVRKDLTRDHETVGEMIGLAARRMDKQSLRSFVGKLDESENRLSLKWIELSEAPKQIRVKDVYVKIERKDDFAQEITTWHRIRGHSKVLGILQVREISHQSARLMQGTIIRNSFQAILSIGGIVLAFALGWSFAKRPDKRMAAKAKRALEGDFSGRIAASDRGTLADMAAAMDIMSEKIESIDAEFRAEVASKIVIVEQLRHADRLKTVGQLTSGVLHELGTPLTIISGRAKMIEEGDVEGAEAKDNAKIVVEQTARISDLIRNILDFARKGKETGNTSDLNTVISKAVILLRPVALKQGVTLRWEPLTQPMFVDAPVSQLQQILANLIINAVQASVSSSQVIVHLEEQSAINPRDADNRADLCVVLSVQDFGEGIAFENMESIFESFFTTKKTGMGTGLGLAISKQIAVENGGWIEVFSRIGEGSEFRVYLPKKEQQ